MSECYEYCIIGYGNVGRFIGYILRREHPLMVSRRLGQGRVTYLFREDDEQTEVSLPSIGLNMPFRCSKAFLTVKAFDVPFVSEMLRDKVETVFSLQNGLGVYEFLVDVFGKDRVFGMPLTYGVMSCGDDCSELAGKGVFYMGPLSSDAGGTVVSGIASLFKMCGYNVELVDDILSFIWLKGLVNIGINPLTALTRKPNGIIVEDDGIREIAVEAVREAERIALSQGIELPTDPVKAMLDVAGMTRRNLSSMLQDVLNGRRTEIDFLNGYIYRKGVELGIDTPVNKLLYFLVKALEKSG